MNVGAHPLLAPSILSCDFARLGEEVRAVSRAGADWIHVDVMDGHFVPNLTIGPDIVAAVKRHTSLPLDVHLMIAQPERHLSAFVKAGADIVTVHAEACIHLHRVVQQIRELGASAGVALNPATPLSALEHILPDLSLVLLMTVNPGFGGQRPIPAAIRKIAAFREWVKAFPTAPLLEVDGGVKADNVRAFAGADIYVSGSYVFLWPEARGSQKEALSEEALSGFYGEALAQIRQNLLAGSSGSDSC